MSKALKDFKNMMVREGQVSKLWKTHSPKAHIAPPKSGNKDKNWQLRLDAEEVKDGKKMGLHLSKLRGHQRVAPKVEGKELQSWESDFCGHQCQ
ncbi:hypothetical protein ABHI18_001583 [Aspergillus niger]